MPVQSTPRARSDGIVIEDFGDEILTYDLQRHQAHCLSPAAAAVWRLCDGRRTVGQIAAQLRRADPNVDDALVWLTLERLHRARLLEEFERRPERLSAPARRELLKRAALLGGLAVVSATVSTPALAATCISCATCEAICDKAGCPSSTPCCDQAGFCGKGGNKKNCACGGVDHNCTPNPKC